MYSVSADSFPRRPITQFYCFCVRLDSRGTLFLNDTLDGTVTMVELQWIIQSLNERTGQECATVVLDAAGEGGVVPEELPRDEALALLDCLKQSDNAVLAMAASTLKVRILMLMQTRSRLAWVA